jgi:nitroreductase
MQATLSAKDVHELKKAPEMDGVLQAFFHRWSPRSFADRDVSPEQLRKVFEAARWTASSFNEQPWRFIVGMRGSTTYDKIFQALSDFNKKWARTAPVLMINAANTKFQQSGKPNRVAFYDLGASAAYLSLQTSVQGLVAHQMEGFDTEAARRAFAIPEEYTIGAAIALGYLGEPGDLGDEQMIQREVAPRNRKPLSEFVFSDWGKPAEL